METAFSVTVPDFGNVIRRDRLLGVFLGQRFALTLLCAPAGYGKSVLAGQLANSGSYHEVIWVSGFDEDATGERILVSAALALSAGRATVLSRADAGTLSRDDAILAIGEALRARAGTSICLVLDGCNRLEGLSSLQELASMLKMLTSSGSSLIVSCRSVISDNSVDPAEAWIVEGQDLRFTEDEVNALTASMSGPRDELSALQLVQRFGGHPALTSLMLRHIGLDDEVSPPRDLVWYVDRILSRLSTQALVLIYTASLLRSDSLEVLRACFAGWPSDGVWHEIESLSPLLLVHHGSATQHFRVHAALRDSVRRITPTRIEEERMLETRARVLRYLESDREYGRIESMLQAECSEPEVAEWCERSGAEILRFVGPNATHALLSRVSPAHVAANPRLLLLRAAVLRDREQYEEARQASQIAADLAEAEADSQLWIRCLLLTARLDLDAGHLEAAKETLSPVACQRRRSLDEHSRRLVEVYVAVAESMGGEAERGIARAREVLRSVRGISDMGSDDAVFVVNGLAAVEGVCSGNWAGAATLLMGLADRNDLSPSQRILLRANLAACYLEIGSLNEAKHLLDEVITETEAAGLSHLAAHAYGTRSSVMYGLGHDRQGLVDFAVCVDTLQSLGHDDVRVAEQLHAAMNRRASGLCEESLALTEAAELTVLNGTAGYMTGSAALHVEKAASLLALGDLWGARRLVELAQEGRELAWMQGCAARADLILAEAARLEGRLDEALGLLVSRQEYVMSGSANRACALYIRAFPGLLGLLAKAIGADNIPLRMLLMIPAETMDAGLEMAKDYLGDEEAAILRRRRGAETPPSVEQAEAGPSHSCYVRLFGGLEVVTEAGAVEDASWRKRKARLLFVTLVLRQHQDVPRDVLLERLWPDMDEEHAKRNFYVTWSTMKRALALGGSPSAAKQFVQVSGGVCRVTKQVRSDLDDFDEALSALRAAALQGEADVARTQARRLTDLYRGELLPGDLYEEWLSETRDRAKHDFCDAMMLAAAMAEGNDDPEESLLYLRKAAAADPWREDVYQSMMRCQMNSGQRSRAIETYMNCRSRLTEDLGIDPSVETTKLYQAVLAMEEGVVI